MSEESEALQEVREYRRRRDSGVEAEEEEKWKEDGELLHEAAMTGDVEVVQYLVEEVGVSVEVELCWRRPLHWAARQGHLAVGRYLVVEGEADVEAEDGGGERPIHYAVQDGHHAFVELLLEQGASADAENGVGNRPLHIAAGSLHLSVVECLLQRRAGSIDVNAQNRYGNTALHLAACVAYDLRCTAEEEQVLELVGLLVEEGEADPLLRNEREQRASNRANYKRFVQVEKYLLEAEEMAEMQKQA